MNNFLEQPNTDFRRVRDGRNSLPLWLDIDLTNARSIAAGSALSINIAGNSFYVDQDTVNVGNATVHFQDTNLGATSAPLFVSAGFIANVPFTQILIENTAQAGKRLRIFYGVDIDFQAGINASITISGTVQVNNTTAQKIPVAQTGSDYTGSYQNAAPLAANTPEVIFTAGANVNGAIVLIASFNSYNAAAFPFPVIIAKATAPTTVVDGDVIVTSENIISGGGGGSLKTPIRIPAGKGLYYITNSAETNSIRQAKYILL
jgi:hypothetical protein